MTVTLVIWLAATVAHFAMAAVAARRLLRNASLDEALFAAVLGGVAGLSFVLHATALSAGLSLGFGLAGLAIWNTVLWAVARRAPAGLPATARPDIFELAALAVLGGIVLAWIGAAAASLDLNGPDAAHYHVPYAVNLAKGDGLFALPATPHLYPMAGSLVAAWFIVPFGDTLLVDLAMVLPFALMVTALHVLFRAMTGESGLRWATWLSLGLFSTPLFRSASAGAADLWFAASFVAVVAIIVSGWARGSWRAPDVILLGGAVGLLVGSKTTGAAALGLVGIGAAGVWILRRLLGRPASDGRAFGVGAVASAAVLALGAGGLWLVRNWILFGSPLAPAGLEVFSLALFRGETHQRTTYYSVLGEMGREGFELTSVAAHYIRQWLGPVFLPSLALALLVAVDVVIAFGRRRTDPRWWARAGALVLIGFSGAALVWMLIGAPWTALERSNGLTLRYALPLFALGPLVALSVLFPISIAGPKHPVVAGVATVVLMAASLWWFRLSAVGAAPPDVLPPLGLVWLTVAGVLVTVVARTRPPRGTLIASIVVGLAAVAAALMAQADGAARRNAQASFDAEETAFAVGTPQPRPWRTAFLAIRSDEKARGRICPARRFFFLVRNDEPMAFQPPALSSRSYYAGRDVEPARRAGPIGDCDYVVTTPALQETDKGRALVDALFGGAARESVAVPSPFVVLRTAR